MNEVNLRDPYTTFERVKKGELNDLEIIRMYNHEHSIVNEYGTIREQESFELCYNKFSSLLKEWCDGENIERIDRKVKLMD